MKKLGATPSDRAYIKRRAAAGVSADDISLECNVRVEVVKNFMPKAKKKRPVNAEKAAAIEAVPSCTTAEDSTAGEAAQESKAKSDVSTPSAEAETTDAPRRNNRQRKG